MPGATCGAAGTGTYSDGRAELPGVPFGDSNCLWLPPDAEEMENGHVMLLDIFSDGLARYRAGGRRGRRERRDLRRGPG
jgi:glutathione-independent formaldehyde dehydrogenase